MGIDWYSFGITTSVIGNARHLLEFTHLEMDAYHKSNGGRPEPIRPSFQPGLVKYAAQEAAKA
jgi:hypothetical protein